jgi:hypothetical protein
MDDNRVIEPITDDFQFNTSTSVNTGTRVPDNVQYADQLPQVANTSTTTGQTSFTPNAQNIMSPNSDLLGDLSLMDIVQMFVVYAFIGAAALSAIFIFVGGISFILSGGNDEKIKQAINTIRYSIIGLIVTILSFTFVAIVGRLFNLNFMGFLSYERIKNDINRLVEPFSAENNNNNFEVRN